MVRKKIDNRIRTLIENGVGLGHRSLLIVVGEKARDQVVILHHMLAKAAIKARPTVLWCYKNELGFTSHRKKRMRALQKKVMHGQMVADESDPFELFVASTKIRYCYYRDTHKILGNTYGMCVLQDFEALTPNLLARTVECVEGGGAVVLLLHSITSLRQLCTLSMDVHARYRTEAQQHVVGRFNERFLLSLAACRHALLLDDRLRLLPLSSHALELQPVPPRSPDPPLPDAAEAGRPAGALVAACRTRDQARALLGLVDAVSARSTRVTVSLTAARGRGKSAALGLALAAAVDLGYANIFVTSPSPENLRTLFEFVLKGFDALDYQEHHDYEVVQSTNVDFNKAVVRVNVFRQHRQTIQYIQPHDAVKLSQAELLAIDEAAAIPLPLVKSLLGPYLVFLSSTINGYEGTGRSLSLKLLEQLRKPSETPGVHGRSLTELSLSESIRYRPGDPVEQWLSALLCLEASIAPASGLCPVPQDCHLYYISRDTLFSYHHAAETFLQRIMAIYVSAHYKNSPNDLQMLSDAPGHHLFCLLGPMSGGASGLPEVLCVLQVCLEGAVSRDSIMDGLSRGRRAAGDLIPWTVAQQFQDSRFAELSGARVVRIATHPDYQRMGYGARALQLLHQYYENKLPSLHADSVLVSSAADSTEQRPLVAADADDQRLSTAAVDSDDERVVPRAHLPPLLVRLHERAPERLQYTGVSFGVTEALLGFWKRSGYVPVYARQTPNQLTGEHTFIMLRLLDRDHETTDESSASPRWLADFFVDFRRRFVTLLSYQFSSFPVSLALSVLENRNVDTDVSGSSAGKSANQSTGSAETGSAGDRGGSGESVLTCDQLREHITCYDLRRLELYANNMADYHLITDLLPPLARLHVLRRLVSVTEYRLSPVQTCLLIGLGLQHKSVDQLATELGLASSQLLGLFSRTVRRLTGCVRSVFEQQVASGSASGPGAAAPVLVAAARTVDEELQEAAGELEERQREELQRLKRMDLDEFAIRGSELDWKSALGAGNRKSTVLSVCTGQKRLDEGVGQNGDNPDVDDVTAQVTVPTSGKKRKFASVKAELRRKSKGNADSNQTKRKWKCTVK